MKHFYGFSGADAAEFAALVTQAIELPRRDTFWQGRGRGNNPTAPEYYPGAPGWTGPKEPDEEGTVYLNEFELSLLDSPDARARLTGQQRAALATMRARITPRTVPTPPDPPGAKGAA